MNQARPVHLVKCKVLTETSTECQHIHTVTSCIVFHTPKEAVTSSMETGTDCTSLVRVIQNRLLFTQRQAAQGAGQVLLLPQGEACLFDLR